MTKKINNPQNARRLLGVVSALLLVAGKPVAADTAEHQLYIKSQRAGSALMELAAKTNSHIAIPKEIGASLQLPVLQGQYTLRAALDEILADTNLAYEFIADDSVVIKKTAAKKKGKKVDIENEEVEEIVVTGTGSNIRGVKNEALPVVAITREDILDTGYATLPDLLINLPQNFSRRVELNGVTYANLRGLGNSYTLVLINGRRQGKGDEKHGTDISMIPLSAVERVEVLTDGAAAIYGSDAVAGVVNIILREDYSGAETTLRYGHDTKSSGFDSWRLTQSLGSSWESGNAMLNYSYNGQ